MSNTCQIYFGKYKYKIYVKYISNIQLLEKYISYTLTYILHIYFSMWGSKLNVQKSGQEKISGWMGTRCVQKTTGISFFEKNIYLFVYINVVAFKIVPIRYYALVPALLRILETLVKLDLWDSL